jgi:hypothetical protein
MKTLLPFILLSLSGLTFGQTSVEATTKDGKTVILDPDGHWFYGVSAPKANNNVSQPDSASRTLADPCKLRMTELPAIRGLKLGMTKMRVVKFYPQLKNVAIDWHTYRPILLRINKEVKELYISMANDRVVSFKVVYYPLIEWKSVSELTQATIKSIPLSIKPSEWMPSEYALPNGVGMAFLSCKDFSINATTEKESYSLEVKDVNFWDRVFEEDDLKKKNFKP